MNGKYSLSRTPGAPTDKTFPTDFKDYPGGVEYFEVYHGPITSTYGQVWWTSTSNSLPDDIIRRYDGKAIAIVGLEIDQVRKTEHGDVPVPINVAYNHHHDTAVVGKGARLVEVAHEDERFAAAGREYIRLDGSTPAQIEPHDMLWSESLQGRLIPHVRQCARGSPRSTARRRAASQRRPCSRMATAASTASRSTLTRRRTPR